MSAAPKIKFAAILAVYLTAIWFLWNTPYIFPIKIFVVFLHEVSHALTAVLSGGSVESIEINRLQGGYAITRGGIPFLSASAGYLGSLFWGVVLARLAMWRRVSGGLTLAILGVLVLVTTAVWVRGEFGWLFGALFGAGCILAGRFLPRTVSRGTVLLLGLTSILYAIWDIKDDIIDRPEVMSDAAILAEMTGFPTMFWGVIWIAVAMFVAWKELVRAFRRAGASGREQAGGE